MAHVPSILLWLSTTLVLQTFSRPVPKEPCKFGHLNIARLNTVNGSEVEYLIPHIHNYIIKRQVDCSLLQDEAPTNNKPIPRPRMSDEDRKKKQDRAFQSLLQMGTIVNHIDSFLMDKGKMILKSFGKMVASEEDPRFS